MTTLRTAAQRALEALTHGCPPDCTDGMTDSGGVHPWGEAVLVPCPTCTAIADLRAALAQQDEPVEPVAWIESPHGAIRANPNYKFTFPSQLLQWQIALYIAPPQRKPLTEEEIVDAVREADLDWHSGWTLDEHEPNRFTTLVRAVERAHGIKE